MDKCSLRHIHDPVLLSLKVEVFFFSISSGIVNKNLCLSSTYVYLALLLSMYINFTFVVLTMNVTDFRRHRYSWT